MPTHELNRFISIPSVFTPSECESIISLSSQFPSSQARVLHRSKGSIPSFHRRCSVTWLKPTPATDFIYMRLWHLAATHNADIWGFDLDTIKSLQYLDYGPLNWFARHVDNGSPAVATRKLSISVQLSPPTHFVGGKLRIWGHGPSRYASNSLGSVTIFPSHLWHQANPVWWGHRHALIAWVEGDTPLR